MLIPFNEPYLDGAELTYIADAIRNQHASGDGPFTKKCHELLSSILGGARVLLTTSCTHALEMAALLLELKPGDEVIVPSFTFVSTVNAFVLRGAKPVFVDVRPDTLNLDERLLRGKMSSRTRAIVPVHYAGVACAMDEILAVAKEGGAAVIEDNAHGLLGKYKGRPLGTMGSLGTLSFHETKNISCGEGGALVVNDPALIGRAEVIREKGTNRSRFFRGEVDKYSWVDIGSSFLPSDLLAAFLYAQLEVREKILKLRKSIWTRYHERLAPWARRTGVQQPFVSPDCESSYHMYYLVMPDLDQRQALIAHLRSREVVAVFHYQPLHISEMGFKLGGRPGDCPVTESVSDRLVRLPFYNGMSEEIQNRVISAVESFPGARK